MPSLGEPGSPAPFEEKHTISVGEARYRLADMVLNLLEGWPFKVKFYPQEREAFAVWFGALVRRWPSLKSKAES